MNPDGVFRARVPILLLLVMAGFLIASFGYRPEARSLPVLVAGVTIGLLLLEILVQTGTTAGRGIERLFGGRRDAARPAESAPMTKALLYAIVWPGFLLGMLLLVGMLPAVLVYVFLSLKVAGRKSVPRALTTAVAVTVFAWVLFEWGLSYELYRGVLIE